jgi:Fungal chitosanase of glycosyl hydrolase group 75
MFASLRLLTAAVLVGAGTATAALAYDPPAASKLAVQGIDFAGATAIDEDYRAEFKSCDDQDIFRGTKMKGWRKCSGDKNNMAAFLKFASGAVFFEGKMSLDLDGSWKACNSPGLADLCPTWYTWPGVAGKKSFIDSDAYPYVVIPIAGPKAHRAEFRDKTAIGRGDFAVVVFDGKIVAAIVGDGGPYNKMGEASNAVFKAVGKDRCRKTNSDGHCVRYKDASLESGALYFIFPGTARADITPANALELMKAEGLARFEKLKQP